MKKKKTTKKIAPGCINPVDGDLLRKSWEDKVNDEETKRLKRHMKACQPCQQLEEEWIVEFRRNTPVGRAMGTPSVPRKKIREAVRKVMAENGRI